jgi:GntR family transcriptional regulator
MLVLQGNEKMFVKLDRNSPIPLYFQLAESIRELIEVGQLKPLDRLPSEKELAEQTGVSRLTVRQAIAYLVRNGSIAIRPGVGTFVAEPKLSADPFHLLGFTEEMIRQGRTASSRVLEQTVAVPSERVAARLALDPDSEVVRIVRLRFSGDSPLLLETVIVPHTLAPGLESDDLSEHSLYEILENRYGLRPERAQQTLEATGANNYEAQLFGVQPGMPMILLEGITYSRQEQPMEFFKAVYRGDQFKFSLESQRNNWHGGPALAPRVNVMISPNAVGND